MKRVINGRKYDTETATLLASWNNGYDINDPNYVEEILYRMTTGEYFVYGRGGANSCYSKWHNGQWYGSNDIIPKSEPRARAWVEELANEDYKKIFGEESE